MKAEGPPFFDRKEKEVCDKRRQRAREMERRERWSIGKMKKNKKK